MACLAAFCARSFVARRLLGRCPDKVDTIVAGAVGDTDGLLQSELDGGGIRFRLTDGEEAHFDPLKGEVVLGRRFPARGAERVFAVLHEVGHSRQARWPIRARGMGLAAGILGAVFGSLLGGATMLLATGVALGVASQVIGNLIPEVQADRWAGRRLLEILRSSRASEGDVAECRVWLAAHRRRRMPAHVLDTLGWALLPAAAWFAAPFFRGSH